MKKSAYEEAIAKLRSLEARGAPAGEQADAWFVELSAIVRSYLERRYDIRAPELTTEEFLVVASKSSELTSTHRTQLTELLERSDCVKFAGYRPESNESIDTLAAARDMLAGATAEPTILDTLPLDIRLKRDSLAEAMGSLARLLRRTEEAPLVASWRALGASPLLQRSARVRQIVDSLVEVDRSRSDFGAAGGVDPIFVALTARAAELGKELEGIAEARRASLRAEMDRLPPIARPRCVRQSTPRPKRPISRDLATCFRFARATVACWFVPVRRRPQ